MRRTERAYRMIPQARVAFRRVAGILCLASAWHWAAPTVTAVEAESPLLQNGSFEAVASVTLPAKGNQFGKWALADDGQGPAGWKLSSAYPGNLAVIEEGAADGQRFLRVTAGPNRAAHLVQPLADLRPGLAYEVTLRYRGGPVELKVYEYDGAGKLKADRAFATGAPAPVREGPWGTLVGIYTIPSGIAKVMLALAVPGASDADLDGVQVKRSERSATRLNVCDFGASGSEYETMAQTTAGSQTILSEEIGDFQIGQQVAISKCNPRICDGGIWGRTPAKSTADFDEQVEARGYDGSLGNWTVYLLDFRGTDPPTFRWSDDLALTWKESQVPVTGDWQRLSGGVEIKLRNAGFWTKPALITFSGRDQLISTIMAIEGNKVTLADPAPITAEGCVVQHTDSAPLQLALNRAVAEGRNVFIPAGRYRLTSGLSLRGADGIAVAGESEERTILDISNGQGACLSVDGGTSVTIRNLRFRGFSGFAERQQMGSLRCYGFARMWGFYVKHCNAIGVRSPERLLVESCHATGMSAECFYSASRGRSGNSDPSRYTKSIVYRHCTVTDCARNAFNNNDHAENTAVLYCRIQDVGGCSWEGASRFVKIVGNYIRNAGTVAIGNTGSRAESLDVLPTGQHIVAHNTFEEQMVYGRCAIRTCHGATPVIISNNVFVNYNTSAIEASGRGDERHLPSANTIITGNAIDLTCVRDESCPRFGIHVSCDDATVSDNQVYVRGEVDPEVRGIVLDEPARNLVVHDNIIRGCAIGLLAQKKIGRVAEVLDGRTFQSGRVMPWPRRRTHCFRDYRIAWQLGREGNFVLGPKIEAFDPDQGVYRLTEDGDLRKGASFALVAPQGLSWNLHHNVINNCTQSVQLDVFGGAGAMFADNILSRGETDNIKVAIEVRGQFVLADNQFTGFDEPDCVTLMLHPDPLGRPRRLVCRDNFFDQCTTPVGDAVPGVWKAAIKSGNLTGNGKPLP